MRTIAGGTFCERARLDDTNLVLLLLEQPIDVVVLVALFGHDDVFGTDDVKERLPLRMLC